MVNFFLPFSVMFILCRFFSGRVSCKGDLGTKLFENFSQGTLHICDFSERLPDTAKKICKNYDNIVNSDVHI